MQTFLPYEDFEEVARTLDNRRLGKQRVEGMQILNIIGKADYVGGWTNHPAVHMWRGYDAALKGYVNAMIREWERRGFRNTMAYYEVAEDEVMRPWWLGDKRLHESHRSNLLRKEPEYYRRFGWDVADDLPYFWPVPSIRKTVEQVEEEDLSGTPEVVKERIVTGKEGELGGPAVMM